LLTPEKRMVTPSNGGVKVGDKINWSYEPRGGYGYTQQIAGVVTKLGREKIQIRVAKRDNGGWVATERWVVPDKLSGRVSRATPEEAAQLIEPETKPMDKIQLRQISDPERDHVQRAIIAQVETDPDLFIERYVGLENAFKGRYVAADLFKETFEAYRASREARNRYNIPVHNAAATLAAEQLSRVLKEPRDPGKDTLLFLTGIPGSGKTSTVLFAGQLPPHCHAVYEGQLADARYAIPKIQAALDAGFKPVINVIHANPEIALGNTYLRFNEHGRGAGANAIAKIQADLPVGLAAIREHFGDQVDLVIHDRRTPEREQKLVGWTHLDILRSEGTYERIRQRLLDKTARDYRGGRISYDCYLQAASRPPRRHARRMVRSSSESQGTDGRRRGVSERGGKENLVSAEGPERQYLTVPYARNEKRPKPPAPNGIGARNCGSSAPKEPAPA
jgi:hypothetical protein